MTDITKIAETSEALGRNQGMMDAFEKLRQFIKVTNPDNVYISKEDLLQFIIDEMIASLEKLSAGKEEEK